MTKIMILGLILMACLNPAAYASDFDLDTLFDDFTVDEGNILSDDVDQELRSERIGVTGQIGASSSLNVTDDDQTVTHSVHGSLVVDLRLQQGIRGLMNMEMDYIHDHEEDNTVGINELFLDANLNRKVYFRGGKQVLKWGRGYFWNPSDLINVEYKDFLETNRPQEGTLGVRAHVPMGIDKNIYVFVGMTDADSLEEFSVASKYEFLVGNTEMSVSAWNKQGSSLVLGYDISTRLAKTDIRGEVGLSHGDNRYMMDYDTLELVKSEDWVPRISIGATQSFNHADITERITVSTELYYNHVGYDKNIFKRLNERSDKILEYLTEVYEPYRNSKYYLAVFSSVKRFGHPNVTLSMNTITNLVDKSTTLSSGLTYQPALSDLSFDLSVSGNLGEEFSEARFYGNKYSVTATASVRF